MTLSRKALIVVLALFAFGLISKFIVNVYDLDETYGQPVQTQSTEQK